MMHSLKRTEASRTLRSLEPRRVNFFQLPSSFSVIWDRSSGCSTNIFGLRARKAATICGKAPARVLPVLDCKEMFSSSRKTRQRNPSHLGLVHPFLPMGKLFRARAFVGVIGGLGKFVERAFGGHPHERNLLSSGVRSTSEPLNFL